MQRAATERAPGAQNLGSGQAVWMCRRPVVDQEILASPKGRESRPGNEYNMGSNELIECCT